MKDILEIKEFDVKIFANFVGQLDEHIKLISQRLNVQISYFGEVITIEADQAQNIEAAKQTLLMLYQEAKHTELNLDKINLVLQNANVQSLVQKEQLSRIIKIRKFIVKPKGFNQNKYIENINKYDINFGIGPAGTGKTFIAVAAAVSALEQNLISRILLVRPAVEAGEKLGFLPGDLTQKIDPYLRPIYDALYEMLGFEQVAKLIERQIIEIAPLAYMRGRTLNNSFVILDESQNTTIEQMKMFLTRIGFGSKAIITGDTTQVDLPKGVKSGLAHAAVILKDIDGIMFSYFNSKDVVRHPLVARIVDAYEKEHNY